jgi:hypothetical protein
MGITVIKKSNMSILKKWKHPSLQSFSGDLLACN